MAEDRTLLLAGWTLHRPPTLPMRLPALLLLVALAPMPAAAWSAAAHGGALYALTTLLPPPALPPAQVRQLRLTLPVKLTFPEGLYVLLYDKICWYLGKASKSRGVLLLLPLCKLPDAVASSCLLQGQVSSLCCPVPPSQCQRHGRTCFHSIPLCSHTLHNLSARYSQHPALSD